MAHCWEMALTAAVGGGQPGPPRGAPNWSSGPVARLGQDLCNAMIQSGGLRSLPEPAPPVLTWLNSGGAPWWRFSSAARCPTDQQDLTAQREGLAALGVASPRIYVDHGLTGTNRDQPGATWPAGGPRGMP